MDQAVNKLLLSPVIHLKEIITYIHYICFEMEFTMIYVSSLKSFELWNLIASVITNSFIFDPQDGITNTLSKW